MEVEADVQCEREVLIQIIENNNVDALSLLEEKDFSAQEHKLIFDLLNNMFINGKEINAVSFVVENKDSLALIDKNFNVPNLLHQIVYGDIAVRINRLKEKTNVRKIVTLRNNINNYLKNNKKADEMFCEIENEMLKFQTLTERTEVTPEEMAINCIKTVEERKANKGNNKKLIFTSYKKLNYAIGGFEKGDLVIISAKSGEGKSAFSMNIGYQIGMIQKRPTYYINSEMTSDQMSLRWAAITSNFNYRKMKTGDITDDDFVKICQNVDKIHNGKLYTLTMPDLQIAKAMAEIRKAKRRYGIEVVFIDYIGRMDMAENSERKDWELLLSAARKLKTMAQQLGMVVVMIAQLSKSGDLAQAGYMKNEADTWINLIKIKEEEKLERLYPFNMVAYINKARNGESDVSVPFLFTGNTLTFIEDKEKAEEWQKNNGKTITSFDDSSDNEPTSFESFAKGNKKNYRKRTF